MSDFYDDNNKFTLPLLALHFADRAAQEDNDFMLDDEAEKHAVRGIETMTYGFGEDEETSHLMCDFVAVTNPSNGNISVVSRPRNPVGGDIMGVRKQVRLVAPII